MRRRFFDILFSGCALLALSPFLLLIAILIKMESPGPAFYRARRMGKDCIPFYVWKFRSMIQDADKRGKNIAEPGDPRVTRLGRFLRLFKIDELPQLLNVLAGDMSVIGPRPEDCEIVERYYTGDQRRILRNKPGLTGLHQVTAFPDMTDEVPAGADPQQYYVDVQLQNRLNVEFAYLERKSFWLDCSIFFRTIYCLLVRSWLYLLFKKRVWINHSKAV